MKNHRFLWLRNRTTDNRKCEKARNIKEKRTIEMFNTVSRQLAVHRSSPRDNQLIFSTAFLFRKRCFLSPNAQRKHPNADYLQPLWAYFRMSKLKRAKAETNMKSEPEKRHTNPAKQAKTLHTACATAALNRICAKQHKGDQAYVHCSNI